MNRRRLIWMAMTTAALPACASTSKSSLVPQSDGAARRLESRTSTTVAIRGAKYTMKRGGSQYIFLE
ncbi:MAG: hypothetical protein JO199_06320, partial [Candidatus Eremiobacteraeota bacterium]|nr:hypothetical protein [Candidatus Eremiobacteraeota bacterium]